MPGAGAAGPRVTSPGGGRPPRRRRAGEAAAARLHHPVVDASPPRATPRLPHRRAARAPPCWPRRRLARRGRRRLAAARPLVGRRAVPARRATPSATTPAPRGAARPRAARPGARAPDARPAGAGRRRPGGRRRAVRRRAGGARRGPRTGRGACVRRLLLGIGEDAHVASLFPEQPAHVRHDARSSRSRVAQAAADPDHPDPAGDQRTAREVWLLAAGEERPARPARPGRGRAAPGARGRGARDRGRMVLLDEAAASRLPRGLGRIASPCTLVPGASAAPELAGGRCRAVGQASPRSLASASARMASPSLSLRRSFT